MTTASWLLLVAAAVLAFGGYRYSLWRHPMRNCHWCSGWGKHRGAVFRHATGDCAARTWVAPRARCDGGRVPRWGVRVLRIGKGS